MKVLTPVLIALLGATAVPGTSGAAVTATGACLSAAQWPQRDSALYRDGSAMRRVQIMNSYDPEVARGRSLCRAAAAGQDVRTQTGALIDNEIRSHGAEAASDVNRLDRAYDALLREKGF